MSKKAKYYFLLFVVVTSALTSLSVSSTPARAQENLEPFIDTRVVDDVKANSYRAAMAACMVEQNSLRAPYDRTTAQDLVNGNWFQVDRKVNVGYFIADTGKMNCSDATFVKGFLNLFYQGDTIPAACALGAQKLFIYEDAQEVPPGTPCDKVFSPEDLYKIPNMPDAATAFAAIDKMRPQNATDVSGSTAPGFNAVELYVVYSNALKAACNVKMIEKSDGTEQQKNRFAALENTDTINVVDADGNSFDVWATRDGGDGLKPTHVREAADGKNKILTDENKKCNELVSLANANAGAYAKWVVDNPNGQGVGSTETKPTDTEKSNCQITGLGWLVCPLVTFVASLADGAYYMLDRLLLRLTPVNINTGDPGNGLYRAWTIMRDIANVVFVIAFLLIVFSQITNIGISNYGIKRMVPKLIAAAILVNTSFFICALAVDLSNISGSSLKSLLDTIADSRLTPEDQTGWNSGLATFSWGDTANALLGGVMVIGSGVARSFAGFAVFIPLLFTILPVIASVLVAVLIRQAIVVLLIFMSPLAFVAMLLPNTEGYFKKWLGIFKVMLLFYPIVALVFGASAVASTVLQVAAKDAGPPMETIQGIAAGAIRILPLILIPALMKLATGVLGQFSGIVNNPGKGWFDNRRNAAVENGKIRRAGRVKDIGEFVNGTSSSKVFGGANSRRRRAVGAVTAFGVNNREKKRKDGLSGAESDLETTYLNSTQGQQARNASKSAQKRLDTAQLNAETVRLSSAEGITLQVDSLGANTRKQTAEDRAQSAAISTIAASGLTTQAKRAELGKQLAETRAQTTAMNAMPARVSERLEQANLNKQAADDNFKAAGLAGVAGSTSGQAALVSAKDAEARKHRAENRAETTAIIGASHALEIAAKVAETEKHTAENEAQTVVTRALAGSVADRDQRRSELELQTAKTGADANWAGQTVSDPTLRDLTQEVQTNQAAAGVAQGVSGRQFNARLANPAGAADVQSALGGITSQEVTAAIDTARAEAEDKEIRRAQQPIQNEIAQVRTGTHPTFAGTDVDAFLEDRAQDGTRNDFERGAALYEAARLGRSRVIADLETSTSPHVNQERLRRAIDSNASALIDKAPDIVKGSPHAGFGSAPGSKVARFAPDTMNRYADYLVSQITTGTATDVANAESALNAAIDDILGDTTNLTALDIDAGNRLRESLEAAAAANPAVAARTGMALSSMHTNTKFNR